jgi:hypothetical protein
MVFSNLEAPRSWLFGVLWVLHCACMSDYILSHWRSTSPQALSSLTKDWGMELKCLNTLILPNFFWWSASTLKLPKGCQPLVSSLAYMKTLITLTITRILGVLCHNITPWIGDEVGSRIVVMSLSAGVFLFFILSNKYLIEFMSCKIIYLIFKNLFRQGDVIYYKCFW